MTRVREEHTLDKGINMFSIFKSKKAKKAAKKASPAKAKALRKRPVPRIKPERRPPIGSMEHMLLKMRQELLAEISKSKGQESEVSTVEIGDVYDISSQDRERDLILTLSDMERSKLKEIDDALGRIKDKTYGICEECGEKIPPARLKVLPFTKVCVDCKSKLEKEERMKKVLEEDEAHGAIMYQENEEEEP